MIIMAKIPPGIWKHFELAYDEAKGDLLLRFSHISISYAQHDTHRKYVSCPSLKHCILELSIGSTHKIIT